LEQANAQTVSLASILQPMVLLLAIFVLLESMPFSLVQENAFLAIVYTRD
jgi:hypothetical protein